MFKDNKIEIRIVKQMPLCIYFYLNHSSAQTFFDNKNCLALEGKKTSKYDTQELFQREPDPKKEN